MGCTIGSQTNELFQCYNGDRHPATIKCDGIVDCVGSSMEDETDTDCGMHIYI